ncbi:MAG TPA: type II CAAX endopeptidase family protein [Acidimicrobiales bacterium]
MAVAQTPTAADTDTRTAPARAWVASHPIPAFFAGAYLISWVLWAPAALGFDGGLGTALFFVGVFGPMAAAATVVHLGGGSAREWARKIFHVRFDRRWFLFALGLPFAIAAISSAGFVLAGETLDFDLLGERLAMLLPLLVVTFLLNGGPEEPGWRGFALPRLQERLSPVRATTLLGVLWALWHLPLLAIEDNPSHGLDTWGFAATSALFIVGVVLYAFPYTYLWNRTKSAIAAMALHAGFNTSLAVVILRDEDSLVEGTYLVMQVSQTMVLLAVAVGLVLATGGRLGREAAGTT